MLHFEPIRILDPVSEKKRTRILLTQKYRILVLVGPKQRKYLLKGFHKAFILIYIVDFWLSLKKVDKYGFIDYRFKTYWIRIRCLRKKEEKYLWIPKRPDPDSAPQHLSYEWKSVFWSQQVLHDMTLCPCSIDWL